AACPIDSIRVRASAKSFMIHCAVFTSSGGGGTNRAVPGRAPPIQSLLSSELTRGLCTAASLGEEYAVNFSQQLQ
ncbi:hypothetical protein ACFL2Q_05185, partial [Thermodesulfobacteriota bacterium]